MEGKTILVIGASSGIGLGLVKELSKQGANIIAASRTAAADFDNISNLSFHELDILEESPDFSFLPKELHGVVYCPGSINLKPFHRFSLEEFKADWEINVLGAVKTLQAALQPLKKTKNASVVLYSTVASTLGMGFHASIASAKSGVEGLAKSLAAEWALQNIRVNVVAPSITDTPLAENLLSKPERREASAKRHPLQRVGEVQDMVEASIFLLSEKSSWMTGQTLNVDGGMSKVKLL